MNREDKQKNLKHGNFSINRSKSSYLYDYLAWQSVRKCPLMVVSLLLRTAMLSIQCVQEKKNVLCLTLAWLPNHLLRCTWPEIFFSICSHPSGHRRGSFRWRRAIWTPSWWKWMSCWAGWVGKATSLLKHTDLTESVFSSLKKTAVLFWNLLSNFQLCSWDTGVMVG